ncbi:MAG: hypothetical protein GC182_04580 [Rhodopseudomonas sp.]|nr:hypothetical protein [Rhodopseudomonas sp.]
MTKNTGPSMAAGAELAIVAARICSACPDRDATETGFSGMIRPVRGRSGSGVVNQFLRSRAQLKAQRIVHPCK